MKKTVTANLAGTVFHIEEDAYEQLQRYLAGIRSNFSGSAGADEIMADIEARIAELFTERLTGRNVVTLADVQHVEGVMGRPEDFAGDDDARAPGGTPPPSGKRGNRRLFRDADDKWIGGVLSGAGHYIGVDALWLRIAFIALVWFGWGTPIIIYLLLWILVPKAETSAEKLEMRGEPVTVDNLKRVFEEGADRVKTGGERVAQDARDLGRNWEPRARRAGDGAANVVRKLLGVIIVVFAFGLLMSLIGLFVGGTVSLWHATWSNTDFGLLDMGELVFPSRAHAIWFGLGAFTLLAVPVVALFLAGFHLLLDTRTPKWLGWSLVLLWFAALFPTVISGLGIASDFRRENSVRSELPITQPTEGLLYIDALVPPDTNSWSISYDDGDMDVEFDGLHVEDGLVHGAWAEMDVAQSADSLYHLILVREAHAHTAKSALDRAQRIEVRYRQEGDALLLSPVVTFSVADKFRAQNAHFTLQVPVGRSVFFRKDSRAVIYDIENTTNTHDSKMLGRTWTMTPQGLEDPQAPLDKKEEAAPVDTARSGPVAAVVWRGPSKRPPAAKQRSAANPSRTVTTAEAGSVQLPNLVRVFSSIISI